MKEFIQCSTNIHRLSPLGQNCVCALGHHCEGVGTAPQAQRWGGGVQMVTPTKDNDKAPAQGCDREAEGLWRPQEDLMKVRAGTRWLPRERDWVRAELGSECVLPSFLPLLQPAFGHCMPAGPRCCPKHKSKLSTIRWGSLCSLCLSALFPTAIAHTPSTTLSL